MTVGQRILIAKTCTGCGELLLSDCFKFTGSKGYLNPRCRICEAALRRAGGSPWKKKMRPRQLVARSCVGCGEIKMADEFAIKSSRCRPCASRHTVDWQRSHLSPQQQSDATIRKHQKRQAKSLDTASRRGYQWTGPEFELLARDDLSNVQLAEMLGRTFHAVRFMRHQLKRQLPRAVYMAGVSDRT